MKILFLFILVSVNSFAHEFTVCDENGMADIYPCKKIDLMRRLHIDKMGGNTTESGSDIWGWTDPQTNKEYALMTISSGTSFVDITDAKNPVYLGKLKTATRNSTWRDVKTYKNHAYIVSEARNHGLQVFDLTKLRDLENIPVDFNADTQINFFGNAHNIVINESSGFAYAVGTNTCSGGLHMLNLEDPKNPTDAGCFAQDGYTHDAQCVNYNGPDSKYAGKEICFNANEDTVTLVDVTNKTTPQQISKTSYAGSQYTHQGWLTEDQRYYLMNDELDEQSAGFNTKTFIWDMLSLESPKLIGFYNGPKKSIDHNLYIKGKYAYLTNYTSGLSIIDISDIGNGNLVEIANFDGYPNSDTATFDGAWSNYPYFASGNVIMSDIQGGLFILNPQLCRTITTTTDLLASANGDNSIKLEWDLDLTEGESYNIYRSQGGCDVDKFEKIANNISTTSFVDDNVTGLVNVGYKISKTLTDTSDTCESKKSVCVEIKTTGACTIPPKFSGINSVTNSATATCGADIKWSNASSYCNADIKYDVFKSTEPSFLPDSSNKIASNLTSNEFHDFDVSNNNEYFYLVRATDTLNGNQETNILKLSDKVNGPNAIGTWSDGAEIGDSGIDTSAKHIGWERVNETKNSGQRSYWSQNNPSSCSALTTGMITLSADNTSELSFWTSYDIESRFDGGVVEILADDDNWDGVNLSPDYPNNFRRSSDACGYLASDRAFSGTEQNWTKHTVDLSEHKGKDIKIRWNYSSDQQTNGQGWFVDDISITNTQVPSACVTKVPTKIQPGLWYDPSRSGHGFVIEPIGINDLYFTVFYTYNDDGTPQWYTSLSTFEEGKLNLNLDNHTLRRFTYDYSISPVGQAQPNIVDESIGVNILSIDFNSESLLNSDICVDEINNNSRTASASWQLGDTTGNWCIEPLIAQSSYPNLDFGGTWWTGNDDDGWGLSLAFTNDTLVVIVYYYDEEGNPRWVLGQQNNFEISKEITIDLKEFHGFGRTATPITVTNEIAGSVTLKINSNTQTLTTDGKITIDINYQGIQGGNWHRENMNLTNLSQAH